MKTHFVMIVSILMTILIYPFGMLAQDAGKTVSLVVSGKGSSKADATKQALRSAIEQVFGTFVSSNTEILDDDIIKDEIITVSSGNISNYKEISALKNADGTQSVTIEATVSIGKLTNFAKSKGMSAELATGAFALNMKIRELNKQNEIQAFKNLHLQMEKMYERLPFFDFRLELSEPYQEGSKYAVKATVFMTPNLNLIKFRNLYFSTLSTLSLTETEVEEYERANLPVLRVPFNYSLGSDDEDWLLEYFQIPRPERTGGEGGHPIYLRNVEKNYPQKYFTFDLVPKQLEFRIKDNVGVIARNCIRIPEFCTAGYRTAGYRIDYCYRDLTVDSPYIVMAENKNVRNVEKTQIDFYCIQEASGRVIAAPCIYPEFYYEYGGEIIRSFDIPHVSFELLYTPEEFSKINSIEIEPYVCEYLEK